MAAFRTLVRSAIIASALVVSLQPCQALSFVLGPYVVFFEPGSARLDDEDKALLDQAFRAWAAYRIGGFELSGHTDRTGPASRHRKLSCARAAAVSEYLIARGFPEDRIWVVGWGSNRPLVETPSGVASEHNRRVEIIAVDETVQASSEVVAKC